MTVWQMKLIRRLLGIYFQKIAFALTYREALRSSSVMLRIC